eukprot:2713708-Pyramimonas_sp.AAC.1
MRFPGYRAPHKGPARGRVIRNLSAKRGAATTRAVPLAPWAELRAGARARASRAATSEELRRARMPSAVLQ